MENQNPFKRIALSLSGGGFRAASFGLGAMKLLDEAGLLEKVHMLSTISGGTITGAYYAVNAKRKKPFAQIFAELYEILNDDRIVNVALDVLEYKEVDVPSKRQNVILSFAEAYDRLIFNKEKFGIFWQGERDKCLNEKDFHLKEIIFNATDFESGIAFRFWKSMGSPRIGNGFNNINKAQAKYLRMADILAASSCFPGGFEPIGIPDDFNWDNKDNYKSVKEALDGINVPLMDGGVYDNQGFDSLLLANKNNRDYLEGHPDDPAKTENRQVSSLFVIIDVAGAGRDFFEMPDPGQDSVDDSTLEDKFSKIKATIKKVFKIKSWIFVLFILLTLAMLGLGVLSLVIDAIPWYLVFGFAVPALLFGGMCWVLKKVGSKIDSLKNKYSTKVQPEIEKMEKKYPDIVPEAKEAFGNLSLNRIIDMIEIRAKSVLAMTSGIFMKRIRSQGFSEVFSDEKLEKRSVASLINDLTKKDGPAVPSFLKSDHLRNKAKNAAGMPTTLWLKDNKSKLKDLVASGRFTLCYNLLKYIDKIRKDSGKTGDVEGPALTAEVKEVEKKLKAIWSKIKKDPYYDIERS